LGRSKENIMNRTIKRPVFWLGVQALAILLLLQFVPTALAQDQDYDQDPPTRAGRIGFVQGSVSFQPGGEGDWVQAVPNRPLTVGDNLWVDRDSRAEIQVGSTSIRLGPETSLSFLDLGNNNTQLRLSMGSLFFRVRNYGGEDAFEVDTPNLAFNVNRPGEFRLDVNENGDQTIATVWRGEGEITGAGNSYRLGEGQQGTFSGVDQLNYDIAGIGREDDFTQWSRSRDARFDRVRSREYVSAEMTGYEDLDDYGRWQNVPEYGNVWYPTNVPGDWAPYRYGHWVYVSPWGWTWVEDEPWGFAPFHYGRWAFFGSRWCWVPGPVAVAPVYSPALVAFVGGGGFSIGVGVGSGVGWFPLGPGEVFVPWYRTSPRYVQNVNVTNTRVNVTQVTNVYNNVTVNKVTNITYVNQRVNNSVTVVNHDTFVNARSVHNNIVRVDARQAASAPVTREVRDIRPERQSLVGTARPIQARPPQQVMTRQVVATREPKPMNRPSPVAGVERTAAPPPVKTVRAAPAAEAQTLQRGAKGTGRPAGQPAMNEGARPGAPENNRPGAGNNNPAPRPGAPENRPGTGNNPNAVPRPGAQENRPENRPSENRPAAPDNNRPGAGNNRPVPRPGAPEAAPRPGAPDNNRPDNNRPDNNRPNVARPNEAPRPGAPENNPAPATRPNAPENRPSPPENNRGVPRPPSANRPESAPEQPRENPNRPDTSNRGKPQQETPRAQPEQPSRPPQTQQESAPRRNEAAPPQNENRGPAARQEPRNEPPSRPEARPAQPQQQENRGGDRGNQKKQQNDDRKDRDKDKNDNKPPHFR
jgi:hypothetical protein